MKKRILVTAVGGDLGRDTVKCFRDHASDLFIAGADMDPFAGGRALVDEFLTAPPATAVDYGNKIRDSISRWKIQTIVPSSEVEIDFFNLHRKEFRDVELLIQNQEILSIAGDKYATAAWLKEAGFPHPATYLYKDFREQLPWPVIVKDRHGSGSQSVSVVRNREELSMHAVRLKAPIVQEFLPGDDQEYTVAVFSTGQEIREIQFLRKLGLAGLSQRCRLVRDSGLSAFIDKIGRKLDLRGSLNIQLRKTDRGYIPFEFNPRLSSTVFVRHRLGFQDAVWWVELASGGISSYNPTSRDVVAVRVVDEVFYDAGTQKILNEPMGRN